MNEHVHLHPCDPLFMYPKSNLERVSERDGCKPGEQIGVFGLVPIGRKLVGRSDHEGVALDS